MKIFTTPRFEKRLKVFLKFRPDLKEKVRETMNHITSNPFASNLKTHKLSGQLKRYHSSRITYEYRIIFILEEDELCFIDIGSHDKVY
ncbi:MAG TPA: type II toxin-antitoxin system mRNA interferase toxin, RelE/StbE family [Candidatus Vogelbacteria bacterium]|nr:type II toxin-antitoxin system mRNA interferase toxin, RelE/StbE family [Candidatus Vogelbacteria bacterium]